MYQCPYTHPLFYLHIKYHKIFQQGVLLKVLSFTYHIYTENYCRSADLFSKSSLQVPINLTFNLKTLLTYIPTSFVHCKPQISGKVLLLLSLYLHCCFLPLCYLTTSLHIVFQKCLFLTRLILTHFSSVKVSDIEKENSMGNEFANSGKYHCTGLHFDIILRAIEARTFAWGFFSSCSLKYRRTC